jgi:RimJ/RimL family protein N-acetyltransferase
MGFGYWAVEERSSGDFIGEVGFGDFKREIDPPIRNIPELGWVLVPRAQGKGYATEAVRATLDWGRTNLASQSTTCLIHPENLASIRVADKCGFTRHCQTTYKNAPVLILSRLLKF